MNLIVNILSDHTIPTTLFIKEMFEDDDEVLFISTKRTQESKTAEIVLNAININKAVDEIVVNENSVQDIKLKLAKYDFNRFDEILVNITGGTKIMSLAVYDFFKSQDAQIFYISNNLRCYKIYPERNLKDFEFENKLSIDEYLHSYNFKIDNASTTKFEESYINDFYQWFTVEKNDNDYTVISEIQKSRGKKIKFSDNDEIHKLVVKTKLPIKKNYELDKKDTTFLTGDWFELYIGNRIKSQLGLTDDYIKIGASLTKNNTQNEFDILFIYKNVLYVIECKTYIKSTNKPSLITDTIYKNASLIKRMGLFGRSFIFTLNNSEDLDEKHIQRAKDFGLTIVTREDIEGDFVKNILKLG